MPAFGEKYPALKVEKYKELLIVVENIPKRGLGLTKEDVIKAVKLKLLGVGVKPEVFSLQAIRDAKHYLYVQ